MENPQSFEIHHLKYLVCIFIIYIIKRESSTFMCVYPPRTPAPSGRCAVEAHQPSPPIGGERTHFCACPEAGDVVPGAESI